MKTFVLACINNQWVSASSRGYWLCKPTTLLLLAAVLSTASSCARHGSLQHKTRWYKHHSSGKAAPCPCDH